MFFIGAVIGMVGSGGGGLRWGNAAGDAKRVADYASSPFKTIPLLQMRPGLGCGAMVHLGARTAAAGT
jgi:hypothetical protein